MAHRKLRQFAELETFSNCIVLPWQTARMDKFHLKGRWNRDYFKNDLPITLELGCGKGEFTVGLARRYPGRNFIGVDIKGNRIWRGAKTCLEEGLGNAAFLRTRIDFIDRAFGENEVEEVWITFPDPQKEKARKRLTHPMFLDRYRHFLKPGSRIHLKTDSELLYEYTLEVIREGSLMAEISTSDLYSEMPHLEAAGIRTFYENLWLKEGKRIKYLCFFPTTPAPRQR